MISRLCSELGPVVSIEVVSQREMNAVIWFVFSYSTRIEPNALHS